MAFSIIFLQQKQKKAHKAMKIYLQKLHKHWSQAHRHLFAEGKISAAHILIELKEAFLIC